VSARGPEPEPLLTPAEVASMFRVDPKTVTRWARAGKITSIRTLGGHRRYRENEVRELLATGSDGRCLSCGYKRTSASHAAACKTTASAS
jgi:excisionase family DNA binding protein